MGKHLLFLHLENIFEKIRPSLRIAWPSECQTSQSYMVSFPQSEEAGENGSFGRPEYWSPALKSQAQQCITITLRINVGLSRWICENSLISLTELLSSKLWDTVPKKQGKEWSKALISDMWICTCIHITHIHTHARTHALAHNRETGWAVLSHPYCWVTLYLYSWEENIWSTNSCIIITLVCSGTPV